MKIQGEHGPLLPAADTHVYGIDFAEALNTIGFMVLNIYVYPFSNKYK